MTNKQLSIVVFVIVLLVIVLGGVVYFRNSGPSDDIAKDEESTNTNTNNEQRLVVTHAYDGDVHEYTGSVVLPTPCHSLEASSFVAESFPEQITIMLATISPDDDVVCTQVLERATFDVFIPASEGAKLMQVVLDSTPIDFEVFEEFKG